MPNNSALAKFGLYARLSSKTERSDVSLSCDAETIGWIKDFAADDHFKAADIPQHYTLPLRTDET
jgi:hypothetical protein